MPSVPQDPQAPLWDVETQRVIIGVLVERLGGHVVITEQEWAASAANKGQCSLYTEVVDGEAAGAALHLSIIPGKVTK